MAKRSCAENSPANSGASISVTILGNRKEQIFAFLTPFEIQLSPDAINDIDNGFEYYHLKSFGLGNAFAVEK